MLATTNFLALTPVRFVLVGVLNTLSGLGVIYALKLLLSMNDVAANFVGYSVGLLIGYVLNARWTFSFRGPLSAAAGTLRAADPGRLSDQSCRRWGGFALVRLEWLPCASLQGVLPYAAVTYFGAKYLVFRAAPAGAAKHDACDAAKPDSGITQNRKRDARA